ncbi:unnamed protein product [Miscanthus lutarioriparius]|uniref:Uncharacterized protein n=1 Tax=Miscanthus lutarioriparius TaxID=422564 RepID=A0A811SI62_9POAL|nr:unnamed protein product [Miscanthus lutarioriparius]
MILTENAVPTLVSIANNRQPTDNHTAEPKKGPDKQDYRVQNVIKLTEKWTINCTIRIRTWTYAYKMIRSKGDPLDPLNSSRSPVDPSKHLNLHNGYDEVTTSVSGRADDLSYRCSSDTFDPDGRTFNISGNWTVLSTEGDKPIPRFYHAAAIVSSKMVVFGGDSGQRLLGDTKILNLEKLTWDSAPPKVYPSPSGRSMKLPACKGHCLVPWGNSVILVGGKTEPASDRLSVWTFNTETELWSLIEAKGDIPAARSGHTVIRAGATLILFGGEDTKGKKRHDLHMFDLKSSTWLPLNYKGTGPSPRSNHVATLYDDRILLIFGGHSKSKILNDLYSLDFDTMVWSRVKTHGPHPSPQAGCSGTLCGTKWYIAGGASKKKLPPSSSITTKKGFSMVPFYHRDKIALIAFGGNKKEPSNKVEVLVVLQNEHSFSWRSAPEVDRVLYEYPPSNKELADHLNKCAPLYSNSSIARHSLTSVIEHPPRREPLSESLLKQSSLGTSLHGQLDQVEECSLDCFLQPKGHRSKRTGPGIQNDIAENMVTGGSNELHSTRRVLAGEQSRAFQLQVEVFHLKQRLQILEGRSGTPTKQPL